MGYSGWREPEIELNRVGAVYQRHSEKPPLDNSLKSVFHCLTEDQKLQLDRKGLLNTTI